MVKSAFYGKTFGIEWYPYNPSLLYSFPKKG
jgi:hypothetical protein